MLPSEYFRRHVYACFSYKKVGPEKLIDEVGVENILFETDFRTPAASTATRPRRSRPTSAANLGGQPEEVQHRLLFKNAADLYGIRLNPPGRA